MNAGGDEVIPISQLFFDDAGPHIVRATTSPEEFGGTTLAVQDATRVGSRSTLRSTTPVSGTGRFTPARGRELQDLLGTSIAQLGGVSGARRKTPAPAPAVPIESLLYRGRAALERALEIRTTVRQAGRAPAAETIDELLDLVGLAAEE